MWTLIGFGTQHTFASHLVELEICEPMLVDDDTRTAAEAELREGIGKADFPCVGAKSALARGTLKTLVCHSLRSGWDDVK